MRRRLTAIFYESNGFVKTRLIRRKIFSAKAKKFLKIDPYGNQFLKILKFLKKKLKVALTVINFRDFL